MEVKVLGSVSPYPKDNRNCSGYLIKNGESRILLDCGSGSSRLLNFPNDLNRLMIIISHLHPDHFSDIFGIINACNIYNKLGIINESIKIVLPYKKRRESDSDYYSYMLLKSYENKNIQFIEIGEETLFHEEFSILFKHTDHYVTNNAIRIENNGNSVGYTGDTGNKSIDELSVFFKDVNLLICEATFLKTDNAVSNDHLHAFEAAELAKKSNAEKLIVTHFWPEHDISEYVEECSAIFDNVIAAKEGLILKLK